MDIQGWQRMKMAGGIARMAKLILVTQDLRKTTMAGGIAVMDRLILR